MTYTQARNDIATEPPVVELLTESKRHPVENLSFGSEARRLGRAHSPKRTGA